MCDCADGTVEVVASLLAEREEPSSFLRREQVAVLRGIEILDRAAQVQQSAGDGQPCGFASFSIAGRAVHHAVRDGRRSLDVGVPERMHSSELLLKRVAVDVQLQQIVDERRDLRVEAFGGVGREGRRLRRLIRRHGGNGLRRSQNERRDGRARGKGGVSHGRSSGVGCGWRSDSRGDYGGARAVLSIERIIRSRISKVGGSITSSSWRAP